MLPALNRRVFHRVNRPRSAEILVAKLLEEAQNEIDELTKLGPISTRSVVCNACVYLM